MEVRVLAYIRELARRHRVLLLGGHAMILHGLDRSTTDSDIWLEPLGEVSDWCRQLELLLREYPAAYFWDLATRRRCHPSEVAEVVENFGVIRVDGLEEALDIFRRPNNFSEAQFDEAWSLAASLPEEEVRVLSAIDLLASKADTDRQRISSISPISRGKSAATTPGFSRPAAPTRLVSISPGTPTTRPVGPR